MQTLRIGKDNILKEEYSSHYNSPQIAYPNLLGSWDKGIFCYFHYLLFYKNSLRFTLMILTSSNIPPCGQQC
jgi:hypothetical protein